MEKIPSKYIEKNIKASHVRVGQYIIIKGRPCKVISVSVSKTGKHGHSKVYLECINNETNEHINELCSSNFDLELYEEN